MLLKTEILQKAGFAQTDISQLETTWNAYQTVKKQQVQKVPRIVCTGIYNAGKSTLLNTLCGEERFPTGNVPTTKVVAQAEFDDAIYIDTPGLNAEVEDDQEARNAYESADFILFVSHAQNGGISAAEAEWLKELQEQYTTESLKQRLIYVLTHYGQIEPDERANIEAQFYADLEKALGFRPDKVFCVDSITYQNASAQGKTLLAEHSGIPQLKTYLADLTAHAEEMLCQAREAELKARRGELTDRINQCKAFLEQKLRQGGQESQKKITAVNAAWKKFEKDLDHEMPELEKEISPIGSCYIDLPYSFSRLIVKDRSDSAAKRKLKERLEPIYNKRDRILRDVIDKAMKDVRPQYCFTGLDSAYASCCSRVTQVFNDAVLTLQKLGLSISGIDEISVMPELPSNLASKIEQELRDDVVQHGSNYTLQDYVVYADVDCMEEYVEGIFGNMREVTMYEYDGFDSVKEMEKDMQSSLKCNVNSANRTLNGYWQQFLKKFTPQVEQRKAALQSQINAYQNALKKQSDTAGIKAASEHLKALAQEVSQ